MTHARTSGNTSASAAHVYARRCDPGTEEAFSNLKISLRKFDNVRLAPDGKMIRDVSSPGGTFADTQTLADTPNKRNMAWQYDILPGATTVAAAERRKLNTQAIRNVRTKVKGAEKSVVYLAG